MRKNPINQEPERHESYGLVQFARQTSSPAQSLFGSSVRHGNLICLSIHKGKKYRSYQSDSYMSDGVLCEVLLSPTQFAEAITSFNMGDGVPCTINKVIGDKWDEDKRQWREKCPEVNFREEATNELQEEMSELSERVDILSKDAEEILKSKGTLKKADKVKLLDGLRSVVQEIRSNIPFVHNCFNRSVNKTLVEAKGELDASYQTLREKLGDKMIEAGMMEVPMLQDGNSTDDLSN